MPNDLYDHDALAWSEQQAELLRRVARGERVNNVDWAHVVEEIEDVGLSQLNAVRAYIRQILLHLLKLHGWPELESDRHWRVEVGTFQASLADQYSPSMRQRIDLEKNYLWAARQIGRIAHGGSQGLAPPQNCPVTLDQLLNDPCEDLEAAFSSPATADRGDA